ncbi:MAG: iron-sulfur cluster assembly accessory protein [Elusimicrobia bacterium]|nr:iron-sulfur cluster assembly accessory protein [Elusimicrobiota bacterium]
MSTSTATVALTDRAISKIKEFYTQDAELAGKSLRIFVEAGGCSGYSYGFRFDDAKPTDYKQDYDGFSLVFDEQSGKLISGAEVDYKEEFGNEGFSIKNPNAKKSCGCGNSFEA